MKFKLHYFLSILVLLIGFGGLFGYDLYIKPYVLSQKVVKVKVASGGYLPKNYELSTKDVYLEAVQTKDVPINAIHSIKDVENKILNVNLTDGVILTESLVDVDDLEPGPNEGIYPIPKEAIYAINGSLRSRDKVDIYLVKDRTKEQKSASSDAIDVPSVDSAFLTAVTVNYVRTEDNNDVKDTENGNITNRTTSTGKVSVPELKIPNEDAKQLKQYLEQGDKLWIVRVE
ncbi:hypothetical protein M2444_006114 [Paenibacillus sp. PastF-3]|uniref:hypothetical protein n=1 Tax=unclassified Paenibacillus TaxID=185978 RepID=UPI002472FBA7|nr:hypothetical protein [Paenibacillus sp. PastF-3]MDH6374264.1 hypothetical protein [Paenibacillus sp. PastF-3]